MVEAKLLLPLLFLVQLFLALSLCNAFQSYGEKKVLHMHTFFKWENQSRNQAGCHSQMSARAKKASIIMELKHKDFLSGPIKDWDWNKKLREQIILDNLHVRTLQSRFKNLMSGEIQDLSESAPIPLTSGIKLQTLNYVVRVDLGGRNMSVIVDTGSDLTWVQCQPCKSCYDQQDPLFDPSASPSYQTVLCTSSTCQFLHSGLCGGIGSQPTCNYIVNYGDGSFTRGELGIENLNLGTTLVSNFVFGCGRNNKGLFGGASGLMGLGRSPVSLVSQTSSLFGGVFSYCLPSTETGVSSGSLVFGGDSSVFRNSTPVSYTNMVLIPELSSFYLVNLTGLSVGGVALQSQSFGMNAVLVDSGTVITRLAPSIYRPLRAEFVKQFSGFPPAPSFSILDTCFNLSAYQEVDIPLIRLHFEGDVELNVDVSGIFYFVKTDASQVCLALASLSSDGQIGIIGNYQQKNIRVVYDAKESKLGFAEEICNFV